MVSKRKKLLAIKQTLKDLLYLMRNNNERMISKMECAIDSFIEESASQYTNQKLSEKFSSGEKAVNLLYAYIEHKAKEEQNTKH